jgi:hypothetical protein
LLGPQSCPCHELDHTKQKYKSPESKLVLLVHLDEMPWCAVGDRCICPNAPLQGRHFCAICKKELHGPCSEFYGDDSNITYHNHCFGCSSASDVATATVTNGISTTSALIASNVAITQQSTLVTAKNVDPKAVTWAIITEGGRPSTNPGELGQMVKSVLTICGIDAMSFNMDQLCQICSNLTALT